MQAGYQTAAVDNLIVTFSRYDLRLVAGLYLGALNSLHKAQLLGITHIVVCPRLVDHRDMPALPLVLCSTPQPTLPLQLDPACRSASAQLIGAAGICCIYTRPYRPVRQCV